MSNTFNKVASFNANTQLQTSMAKLMQNTLCVPVAGSYHATVKIVDALVGPVALMKKQIIDALDNNPVMDALNNANKALSILNSNMGFPVLQIDQTGLDAMNIFKTICVDYDDILPNAMKRMIDDVADGISESMEGWFDLPSEIRDQIDDVIDALKDHALSDAFDDVTKAILSPLRMYRNFIKSTGIVDMLKRLRKFERCMTNPKGCARPVKEFYFPNTSTYNSQYYMDLFAINLKGEIQLAKLTGHVRGIEGKMAHTLTNLDTFKQPMRINRNNGSIQSPTISQWDSGGWDSTDWG